MATRKKAAAKKTRKKTTKKAGAKQAPPVVTGGDAPQAALAVAPPPPPTTDLDFLSKQQALDALANEMNEEGHLVIVRGDGPTFALWYGLYAEEQRADVAVVSGPLLAFVWYRDHVRHLYPHIVVNEPAGKGVTWDDLVYDLIISNLPRPTYATDPKELWEERFDFVSEGDSPVSRVHLKPTYEY